MESPCAPQEGRLRLRSEHIKAAHELASSLPDAEALTAVIQIQQGWALFQRGNAARALQVLRSAEDVLKHTDH